MPWERRLLMVGFMLRGLAENSMNGPSQTSLIQSRFYVYDYYWEAQILGSLELKNIRSFEFTEIPPSGSFLLELLKNKVQIFDLRDGGRTEWQPSEEDIRRAKAEL